MVISFKFIIYLINFLTLNNSEIKWCNPKLIAIKQTTVKIKKANTKPFLLNLVLLIHFNKLGLDLKNSNFSKSIKIKIRFTPIANINTRLNSDKFNIASRNLKYVSVVSIV